MSNNRIVTDILNDLQHPSITDELVNEITTTFESEITQSTESEESEQLLYDLIINFCPELR